MESNSKNYIDNYENYRTNIVKILSFLLGVKEEILDINLPKIKKEEYEKNQNLKIIRCLSIIRMNFLINPKVINEGRINLISIEQMPDYVDVEAIKYLRDKGIEVIRSNVSLSVMIAYINQFILEQIDKIRPHFPVWIKWEYIKNLFLMPGCYAGVNGINLNSKTNKNKILSEINNVKRLLFLNKQFYPYGLYLYWPKEKMNDYYGNILFNDEKFLRLLYSAYGNTFHANNYVIDAPIITKDIVYDFIDTASNVSVLVDCENVDPFRFAAVFLNLHKDKIQKIKKIILYDDVNTSNAWDYLERIVNIPVEHKEIERVVEGKSLVDIAITAGACKEYYENKIESIILASSDSDFCGLFQSMPSARYLVLNESDKTSNATLLALKEKGINYCFIDSFAQAEAQSFRENVLYENLKEIIEEFNEHKIFPYDNPDDLLEAVFEPSHIQGTYCEIKQEKEIFKTKYLKVGFIIRVVEKDGKSIYRMEINKA